MKILMITIEKIFSTHKNISFRRIIKKEFSVEGGVRAYHLYVGTTTNSIVEVLFKVRIKYAVVAIAN